MLIKCIVEMLGNKTHSMSHYDIEYSWRTATSTNGFDMCYINLVYGGKNESANT